jgi:hypothetical protein
MHGGVAYILLVLVLFEMHNKPPWRHEIAVRRSLPCQTHYQVTNQGRLNEIDKVHISPAMQVVAD